MGKGKGSGLPVAHLRWARMLLSHPRSWPVARFTLYMNVIYSDPRCTRYQVLSTILARTSLAPTMELLRVLKIAIPPEGTNGMGDSPLLYIFPPGISNLMQIKCTAYSWICERQQIYRVELVRMHQRGKIDVYKMFKCDFLKKEKNTKRVK